METVKKKKEGPICPICHSPASCTRSEVGDWHKYVGEYTLTCSNPNCKHQETEIQHEGAVGYPDYGGSVCSFCHKKH